MSQQQTAVITGASTGIGLATAKVLIDSGFRVFGSVRKEADADRVAKELGAKFEPLILDVTDEEAVRAAATNVRDKLNGQRLSGLVNNAGIGIGGPLLHLPVDKFRQQLEVNLTGVLITTQAFAPLLGVEKGLSGPPGRIANMGSAGGRNAYPFMAPYHTSKFGLEGLTESLRREMMLYDIQVAMIAPASIVTPIWDKSAEYDFSDYEDSDYAEVLETFKQSMLEIGANGLPASVVGEAVLHALTADRPKLRYAISGRPFETWLVENLPKRWVDRIIASRLKIRSREAN